MSNDRPSTSSEPAPDAIRGQRFAAALAVVLRHEGGFVHHPLDPGGATNLGITRATLAAHRGRPVSVAAVRALTEAEAGEIYRRRYWAAVKADALPAGLDLAVFDLAVNSGPGRAARLLQRVLDVREDGVIGPETLAAATARDPAATVRALTEERLRFLQRLKTWKTFGRGWRRRVEDVGAESLRLAGTAGAFPSTAGALSAAARPPIRAVPAAAVPTSDGAAPDAGAAPGARAAPAPTSSPAPSLTLVSKGTAMTDTKSVLASKTVWANLIGLAVLALGFLGVETGAIDQGALAEALTQLVAAASFIASTVFRMSATRRLT